MQSQLYSHHNFGTKLNVSKLCLKEWVLSLPTKKILEEIVNEEELASPDRYYNLLKSCNYWHNGMQL